MYALLGSALTSAKLSQGTGGAPGNTLADFNRDGLAAFLADVK
jgi:hypothetical protein